MGTGFPHFPCVCVVLRLARCPLHFWWAARASCFIGVFLTDRGGGCRLSYVSAGGCVASSFFTVINTRREPRGLSLDGPRGSRFYALSPMFSSVVG